MGQNEVGEVWVAPYPNTCENCTFRGEWEFRHVTMDSPSLKEVKIWNREEYDSYKRDRRNVSDWPVIDSVLPKRCTECHAKSERFRKANQTLRKLDQIRDLMAGGDETAWNGNVSNGKWEYLKFVTLTWRNDFQLNKPQLSKKELAAARLSIRRKRDKIANQLQAVAGTDVMENVKTTIYGCYSGTEEYQQELTRHHLHTHGIWVMPKHEIESIMKVMSKYGIRDQVRAVRDKEYYSNRLEKVVKIDALTRARNYLMKYLTKEKGLKRGNWGLARGELTYDRFWEVLYPNK